MVDVAVAPLHKVTAFCTRARRAADELLVFRHPPEGIQLPAGTVEPDEPPEAAMLRELREETGLTQVEIVARLATIPEGFPPGHCRVLCRLTVRTAPDDDAPLLGWRGGRAAPAIITEVRGEYAHIVYEEHASLAVGPSALWRQSGWVPLLQLTTDVQRHLFHLRPTAATPDRWRVRSDDGLGFEGGLEFEPYWVPLALDPGLVFPQRTWLKRVRDDLIRSAAAVRSRAAID